MRSAEQLDNERASTRATVMRPPVTHHSNPTRWLTDHGRALFAYAYSRVRNRDDAQEVVQEALLAAWRAHHRFAGKSSERTWLIGILKHRLADHWRRQRATRSLEAFDAIDSYDELSHEFGHWQGAPSLRPDPHAGLEQREFWRTVADCLATLPPRQAHAFSLRVLDGLETEEICRILDVAPASLWVTLHRARARMREQLEKQGFGG